MAELQVECVDRHLIAYGQDSHSGEVAGRVGDVSTGSHIGQTQGRPWKTGPQCLDGSILSVEWIRLDSQRQEGGSIF